MKTKLTFISLLLMMGVVIQGYSQEAREALPRTPLTHEDGLPDFLSPSYLIIRVGSPVYNFLRDIGRNSTYLTTDPDHNMWKLGRMLPDPYSFKNIGPNSLLVIKGGRLYKGERPYKGIEGNPSPGPEQAVFLLWREGKGLCELVGESLVNGVVLTLGRSVAQPLESTISTILSDAGLYQRLSNDALAIWESSQAPLYAFVDVVHKAQEGQMTRSVKGMVRIPFSIADLGLVIGNKLLTLPFNIAKSMIDGLADHFSDDSDNTDLLSLLLLMEGGLEKNGTLSLTGTLEDQGIFFGRAGSHRLNVRVDNNLFSKNIFPINVRSSKIDLNEFVGKTVTVRARFSLERRLGMCCSYGYLLMVEDIGVNP